MAAVLPEPDGHGVGEPAPRDRLRTECGAERKLFRRQVIATFEEEELAHQHIPHLGSDSCMWVADYPHTDSTFPESQRAIEETLGMLPVEDRRKITALNCAKLYGSEQRPPSSPARPWPDPWPGSITSHSQCRTPTP